MGEPYDLFPVSMSVHNGIHRTRHSGALRQNVAAGHCCKELFAGTLPVPTTLVHGSPRPPTWTFGGLRHSQLMVLAIPSRAKARVWMKSTHTHTHTLTQNTPLRFENVRLPSSLAMVSVENSRQPVTKCRPVKEARPDS